MLGTGNVVTEYSLFALSTIIIHWNIHQVNSVYVANTILRASSGHMGLCTEDWLLVDMQDLIPAISASD